MNDEPAWNQLLAALSTWADAREVAGGIEVSFIGHHEVQRTVELVMSPEEWEEMAEVIGAETVGSVRHRLLALEADTAFLVSDAGVDLVPSATRELPPDPSDDLVPEPGGQWVVIDDAGTIISRLADWSDGEH